MSIYLPSQPGKAIWYFVLAYWIVTILGILLTVAFAAIFDPPARKNSACRFPRHQPI